MPQRHLWSAIRAHRTCVVPSRFSFVATPFGSPRFLLYGPVHGHVHIMFFSTTWAVDDSRGRQCDCEHTHSSTCSSAPNERQVCLYANPPRNPRHRTKELMHNYTFFFRGLDEDLGASSAQNPRMQECDLHGADGGSFSRVLMRMLSSRSSWRSRLT